MSEVFKFRFHPTKEQVSPIRSMFGAGRFIYNQLLDLTIKDYEAFKETLVSIPKNNRGKFKVTTKTLNNLLFRVVVENPWLREYEHINQFNVIRNLSMDFNAFVDASKADEDAEYPKFMSKYGQQSIGLNKDSYLLRDGVLEVSGGLGELDVEWDRELPQGSCQCALSVDEFGDYYVSLAYKLKGPKVRKVGNHKPTNLTRQEILERRLSRLQRSLTRKEVGSSNYEKAVVEIDQLKLHIANCISRI